MQLTEHQKKTIVKLAGGFRLQARRIFPFPHTYGIYAPEAPGSPVQTIGEATVRGLITKGLVQPQPKDRELWDTIDYLLTPLGQREADGA